MLLIERTEGVETKHIKTSSGSSAGTAYVTFENVSEEGLDIGFLMNGHSLLGQSTRRELAGCWKSWIQSGPM